MGSTVCSECTVLCMFVPPYQISISIPVLIKLHADIFLPWKGTTALYSLFPYNLATAPAPLLCYLYLKCPI